MIKALNSSHRLMRPMFLALCLLVVAGGRCWADYPERPIRLILPFRPAGRSIMSPAW